MSGFSSGRVERQEARGSMPPTRGPHCCCCWDALASVVFVDSTLTKIKSNSVLEQVQEAAGAIAGCRPGQPQRVRPGGEHA